jgi:hypothetical protein
MSDKPNPRYRILLSLYLPRVEDTWYVPGLQMCQVVRVSQKNIKDTFLGVALVVLLLDCLASLEDNFLAMIKGEHFLVSSEEKGIPTSVGFDHTRKCLFQ